MLSLAQPDVYSSSQAEDTSRIRSGALPTSFPPYLYTLFGVFRKMLRTRGGILPKEQHITGQDTCI